MKYRGLWESNRPRQHKLQDCNKSLELAAVQTRGGNTKMDPLRLGRPPVFTGYKAACEDWAFKLKVFMGQESTTAVQWMCGMESSPDSLDHDLYTDEKKKEAVAQSVLSPSRVDRQHRAGHCQAAIGNQDGFEAYRRLAVRCAPRTLGRNLTRLTSIIDHHFNWVR
eukprot:5522629-Amphidinium_carterae.1